MPTLTKPLRCHVAATGEPVTLPAGTDVRATWFDSHGRVWIRSAGRHTMHVSSLKWAATGLTAQPANVPEEYPHAT